MMVTTRNSVKIFKFADIICAYCVPEREKTRLHELQEKLECANENEEKSLKRELKKEQERFNLELVKEKIKNQVWMLQQAWRQNLNKTITIVSGY